jgi:hypothetical protein
MAYIGSYPADRTSGAKPRDEYVGNGSNEDWGLVDGAVTSELDFGSI